MRNSDIYEALENGGFDVEDLEDMTLSEMEDYFCDLDPAEFL